MFWPENNEQRMLNLSDEMTFNIFPNQSNDETFSPEQYAKKKSNNFAIISAMI